MLKDSEYSIVEISLGVVLCVVAFYVLSIGASFLIPFIIALLFSFAIIGLQNFYNKFAPWKPLSLIASIGTYIFLFWLIGKMIGSNIDDLIVLLPEYQDRVTAIIHSIFEYFGVSKLEGIDDILNKFDLQYIVGGLISGVTSIFSSAGLILFYVLFLLLEYRYFGDKLNLMFTNDGRKKQVIDTITKIKHDIKAYFAIKTLVSLVVGAGSWIIMVIFGLDFALFWAFLIFALNFIPNVGSVIAVTMPVLLSLVQFDNFYMVVLMATLLICVQVLMGNFVEPKFVGNKLNLSPLVIILALAFWGTLWGVVGMLLSVPIMVIINIILGKIPATRSLAILLSEKGELEVEAQEEVIKTRKRLIKKVKEKFTK